MALALNTAELMFLKALIEDRVQDLDVSLIRFGLQRAAAEPPTDEEFSVQLVRTVHTNMLHKIEQELDVPWPVLS